MSTKLSRFIKDVIYWTLNLLGANAYFRKKNLESVSVFRLHGVADYDAECSWKPLRDRLDVKKLRFYLTILSKKYKFVSMKHAIEILNGERSPITNCAVLTFDDGYRNNFTHALPVLREFGIPAVFYLATDYVETGEPFWFDRLDFLMQAAAKRKVKFSIGERSFSFESDNRQAASMLYADLRQFCKEKFRDEREFVRVIENVARHLETATNESLNEDLTNDQWAGVVGRDQIKSLSSDDLVCFGSHTVSHLRLGCASTDQMREELSASKRKIEEWCGYTCEHFAYPMGDYDDQSAQAVEETGYRSAVTSDHGRNAIGTDVYKIKRLNVSNNSTGPVLLARASGLEDAIATCVDKFREVESR